MRISLNFCQLKDPEERESLPVIQRRLPSTRIFVTDLNQQTTYEAFSNQFYSNNHNSSRSRTQNNFSTSNVNESTPPPSYEEVMKTYNSTLKWHLVLMTWYDNLLIHRYTAISIVIIKQLLKCICELPYLVLIFERN